MPRLSHAEQGARGHQQALDKTAALIAFSKVTPNTELERPSKWSLPFLNSEYRGGQRADAQRMKGNKPSAPPRPLRCPRVIAMLLSNHSSLFPSAPICPSWEDPKDTEMAQNPVERPDVGDTNTLRLTVIPSSDKGKQPWLGRSMVSARAFEPHTLVLSADPATQVNLGRLHRLSKPPHFHL